MFESWPTTSRRLECRDYIHAALVAEMARRDENPDWEDAERRAVARAATEWAVSHGLDRTVTDADVERVEGSAVGHCDYGSKLALYVAELVVT